MGDYPCFDSCLGSSLGRFSNVCENLETAVGQTVEMLQPSAALTLQTPRKATTS